MACALRGGKVREWGGGRRSSELNGRRLWGSVAAFPNGRYRARSCRRLKLTYPTCLTPIRKAGRQTVRASQREATANRSQYYDRDYDQAKDLAKNAMKSVAAGGAEGNRTPDLCSAIAALSHLSYSPAAGPGAPGGASFSDPRSPVQLRCGPRPARRNAETNLALAR
jgi:hypothetical protein